MQCQRITAQGSQFWAHQILGELEFLILSFPWCPVSSYNMGVIPIKKSLAQAGTLTASAFCRRRLPVILCRMKFCENLKEATTFVQQGHIRVGTDVITDPAFLVTRQLEDFVQWTDTSKIRKKVLAFSEKLDDYDLLEERV